MKLRLRHAAWLLLGLLGFKSTTVFAQDIILCSDAFDGESENTKYPNCMDVLSWSWGMSNSSTTHAGGVGGVGQVSVQDLTTTKFVDKASPDLMLYTTNGKHFPKLELMVWNSCSECGDPPDRTITMEDVIVNSVAVGGSAGEAGRPVESVSFNFSKVEWCYTPKLKDGSPGTPECYGWDIAENTSL